MELSLKFRYLISEENNDMKMAILNEEMENMSKRLKVIITVVSCDCSRLCVFWF